jgi:hypothetical protein
LSIKKQVLSEAAIPTKARSEDGGWRKIPDLEICSGAHSLGTVGHGGCTVWTDIEGILNFRMGCRKRQQRLPPILQVALFRCGSWE